MGIDHAVFQPEISNRVVTQKFKQMQETISEHKKTEKKSGGLKRFKKLFGGNPFMTLKDPDSPSKIEALEQAPQYCSDDENAPSPRQSEYITHPSLSQALRKQTDEEIFHKVAVYARPIKLKT